jgi:hypothetical protein
MVHGVNQPLVDEIMMLRSDKCYPPGRHLGMSKGYDQNKIKPEGSMANEFKWTKTLGFCTKFLSLNAHVRRKVWEFVRGDPKLPCDSGGVLISQ